MHCLRCGTENQETNKFCGNCGAPLAFDALVQSTVGAQLDDALKTKLKDEKVVVVEIADALKERVLAWVKLVGLPVTALLSVLALFGITSVKDILDQKAKIEGAIKTAEQSADHVKQLQTDAETRMSQTQAEVNSLSERLQGQIDQANRTADANRSELDSLREQLRALQYEKPPIGPGQPPYHLSLASVLNDEAQRARIEQAGKLVFQLAGNTGGVRTQVPLQNVANEMMKAIHSSNDAPAFLYLLGNITFYTGAMDGYYAQFYEPFAHYDAPILAIPGNHDGERNARAGTSATTPTLEGYAHAFLSPKPDVPPESKDHARMSMVEPNSYWTLTSPFATIIGLYTNVSEGGFLDGDQRKWLVNELQTAPTDRALIVAMHHSPFLFTPAGGSAYLMGELQDAINKGRRVPNIVLSATANLYQRIEVQVTPQISVPFLVVGNGGYAPLFRQASGATVGDWDREHNARLQASVSDRHGFVTLQLTPSSIGGSLTAVEQAPGAAAPAVETADTFTYSSKVLRLKDGEQVNWRPVKQVAADADQQ